MTRLILQCCLVFLISVPALCACAETPPAVQRQEITVNLVPASHHLIGETEITYPAGTRHVSLRLSPRAQISTVSILSHPVSYTFRDGTLTVELPSTASRAAATITVRYRARFNDPVSEQPMSSEDPTYGVNGAITDKGIFLGSGSGWYPEPDTTPMHRITTITAPAGIEGITSGRRRSRETARGVSSSVWEEAHPVGGLSLSAGNYQVEERRVNGMDLYSYFYPENASLSRRYLDAAEKYLTFYVDLLGPYPFEKFAVVENFFPTGYGLPSYTLLGSTVIRLPFIVDTSFPHEIAHSWWGNGVLVDYRKGNWCEGLVTYLADYLLKERRSPAEGRDYRRQLITEFSTLVTPDRDFPLTRFTSRTDPASRAIGYGKAAMLFHMVRKRIGDQAFFTALREVARQRMYQETSWQEFENAFSRASHQDLSPFMEQWLVRTGGPKLEFKKVHRMRERGAWSVEGTLLQQSPSYQLQVPLQLQTSTMAVQHLQAVAGKRTQFQITSQQEPKRLLLDPEADLFRLLSQAEIPATVNRLKGSKQVVAVITGNCRADEQSLGDFLASMDQQQATVLHEEQLNAKIKEQHDLLFCGLPSRPEFMPSLPAEITISRTGFAVGEDAFGEPDSLLFLVMAHPDAPDHVTALFLPLSQQAAQKYAYKITHYGKYGYLAFAKGGIQLKGIPSSTAGASVLELR